MLRKSARVSGRIAASAILSWSLIPIAVADAPSSAPTETAAQSGQPGGKRLHTVPEDGLGDEQWLSGATQLVRDVLLKRPKEDLVICVAGCVSKQDRVVYAQPADLAVKRSADVQSDASPATDAGKRSEFVPSMAGEEGAAAPVEGAAADSPVQSDETPVEDAPASSDVTDESSADAVH